MPGRETSGRKHQGVGNGGKDSCEPVSESGKVSVAAEQLHGGAL